MASTLESITQILSDKKTMTAISKSLGITAEDAGTVLASVLPELLKGASAQASNKKTQESFAKALEDHSSTSKFNLSSFFKNVDLDDGAKIVGHLLGTKQTSTAKAVSKKTGIDTKEVLKIAAAAAPLILTLVGNETKKQQKKESEASGLGTIAKTLLSNVDATDILKALIK